VVLSRCAAPRKLPSLTTQRNVSIDLKSSMAGFRIDKSDLSIMIKKDD
jgi:hypothetical protein